MGIVPGDLAFHGDKNSVATVALRRTLVDRAAVAHTDACLTISLGLAIAHVSAAGGHDSGLTVGRALGPANVQPAATTDAMTLVALHRAIRNGSSRGRRNA